MFSRRDLLTLRTASARAPTAPVVVTDEVLARAAAFRAELAGRGAASVGPRRAALTDHLCLLRLGTECGTCVEVCPEPGALRRDGARLALDPARCTGCGACVERCPAPIPALALRPGRA